MRRSSRLKWFFLLGPAIFCTALGAYVALAQITPAPAPAADKALLDLDASFNATVKPTLQTYCLSCHSGDKAEAQLDLSTYSSTAAVMKDARHSALLLQRLKAKEMPPKDADQPSAETRQKAIDWFQAARDFELAHNAGDPGIVLARRLSNAEFDYTIRDLTGVDLHPTKEFPVDPANTSGFDNSGESLTMSSALLRKYLAAARAVADHMYLKPQGFAFAPSLMLAETDRDQFCVAQIITMYHQQDINYGDYFRAAWQYKNRAALGKPQATLAETAAQAKVSAKYLATLWNALEVTKETIGPLSKMQALWTGLPAARPGAAGGVPEQGIAALKDFVTKARAKVEMRFLNVQVGGRGNGQGGGGQIPLLWKDIQYASHRLDFDKGQLQVAGEPPTPPLNVANEPNAAGEFGPGRTVPVINTPGDPDLAVPAGQRAEYEAAWSKFCKIFPDKFYMEERGRNYFDTTKDRGRLLSAGFHSSMGYFRDDYPFYALLLDDAQQKQLDEYWLEMDYVASTTARMYLETVNNRTATTGPAAARVEVDPTSDAAVRAAMTRALNGANAVSQEVFKGYYGLINSNLRAVDNAQKTAIPSHIEAVLDFAERAYRHPLSAEDRASLLAYYKDCREKDGLSHEDTIREMIVMIIMSPDVMFRLDMADSGKNIHPLTDYELASRLSYFIWSSIPDAELLAHAKAGDLHKPEVIAAQARRMVQDTRARALAVEFGGNWLEFRRFEEISTVDRTRFTTFTNDLREAMYEEPIRFLTDLFQHDRSILDCLYANDTFVNPVLAKHYGMPIAATKNTDWVHVEEANRFDRGGLLPMAVFLTKNAPGLRTSPVKRGNWVVKNVLGEKIPPPPPTVPELPHDEAKMNLPLREMLAKHRDDPSCFSCHSRIDSFGLVFEGFGPIGERRTKDLADRPVDASASFPNGQELAGVAGLRQYIQAHRQDDFVDNMCGKFISFGLGRSLIPTDDLLIADMHKKLASNGYHFGNMIETLVTSPQFLNKRGSDDQH